MARTAEYMLLTIVVVVIAYLVITPLAQRTANQLNETAELFAQYN